jgi:hypothetical protein
MADQVPGLDAAREQLMTSTILSSAKALRTLRKTGMLLDTLLLGVTQHQAASLRDGPDGWSALSVICHLWDYERVLRERVELMLAEQLPTLPGMANAELAERHAYAGRDLRRTVVELHERRAALVARLDGLDAAAWQRPGLHPEQGHGTLLDVAVNAGLHDVDHLEQLARVLAPLREAAAPGRAS